MSVTPTSYAAEEGPFAAYLTPGWTVHNRAYRPLDIARPLLLPAGVTLVTLFHEFRSAATLAGVGNVVVRRSGSINVGGLSVGPFEVRRDVVNGRVEITVPTTAEQVRYSVYEAFPGGTRYTISVPPSPYLQDLYAVKVDPADPDALSPTVPEGEENQAGPTLEERMVAVEAASSPQSLSFSFTQELATKVWVIEHPLTFRPAGIDVTDTDGAQHYPSTTWPSDTLVRLYFDVPVAGTAILS